MSSPKFLLGERVVEVRVIGGELQASAGGDEWTLTYEQFYNHYTPVSMRADEVCEVARTQHDNGVLTG